MHKKICKKDVRIFEDILILSFFIIHKFYIFFYHERNNLLGYLMN